MEQTDVRLWLKNSKQLAKTDDIRQQEFSEQVRRFKTWLLAKEADLRQGTEELRHLRRQNIPLHACLLSFSFGFYQMI